MLLVEMSIIGLIVPPSGGDTRTRLRHLGSITLLKSAGFTREAGDPDRDRIWRRLRCDLSEATFGAQSLPDDFSATERRLEDGEPYDIGESVDNREHSVCDVVDSDCEH